MSPTRNPGRVAGLWYLLLVVLGPVRLMYIPSRLFADDPRHHRAQHRDSPGAVPLRHPHRPCRRVTSRFSSW